MYLYLVIYPLINYPKLLNWTTNIFDKTNISIVFVPYVKWDTQTIELNLAKPILYILCTHAVEIITVRLVTL